MCNMDETDRRANGLSSVMPAQTSTMPSGHSRDREVIRIDYMHDRAGIATALREAFAEAANDQSSCDLERLLRELN